MRKLKQRALKEIKQKGCPKFQPKDVQRAWTLAARLEHRRIKEKKK